MGNPIRHRRLRVIVPAALLLVGLTSAWPADASAAKPFLRGFSDPVFTYEEEHRTRWYNQSISVGANVVRIDVQWNRVASQDGPPAEPTNPADPAYSFGGIDASVRDAAARGLPVLMTVQYAPNWALGGNPQTPYGGVWKPDPAALGDFAQAIATRYSGSFSPGGQPPLPEVAYLEPWNEPNLPQFLSPQYKGKKNDKPASPDHYRKMLNAAYEGAHAANGDIRVVAGATGPFGDDPGEGDRVRPLRFLRDLLCLRERRGRLEDTRCKQEAKLDVLSHHPISTSGGPNRSAINPDDATVPDFKHVVEILRAAERKGTIQPKGRRPAWATEIWWETNPPDRGSTSFPVAKVARWIPEMLYSLRNQGAQMAIWLQIVDSWVPPDGFSAYQSGLFYLEGEPKPLAQAWRFPFVADRLSKKKVRAWAIPPASGRIAIERRRGADWQAVSHVDANAMRPVAKSLKLSGGADLRATLNGEASPVSKVRSSGARAGGGSSDRAHLRAREAVDPEIDPYVEVP